MLLVDPSRLQPSRDDRKENYTVILPVRTLDAILDVIFMHRLEAIPSSIYWTVGILEISGSKMCWTSINFRKRSFLSWRFSSEGSGTVGDTRLLTEHAVAHTFGSLGRHAFGTISRLFEAYQQLPHARQATFHTHLTMLDIHEATIARDLCMLILLEDLTHADEPHVRDEIKATLMYTFLVPLMPSYCYTRCVTVCRRSWSVYRSFVCSLENVMENIRTRLSTTTPDLPEWLHVKKGSIPGILRALDYWLTTPKSTKTFLSLHEHQKPEVGHGALERTALRTGNIELKRKLDETKAEERRELKASFRSMSDERIMALSFVPQGLSPRKARVFLEEHLEVIVDALQESFKKGRETGYEEQWYGRTKVLLPPKRFMACHDGFDAAWDELKREEEGIDEAELNEVSRRSAFMRS